MKTLSSSRRAWSLALGSSLFALCGVGCAANSSPEAEGQPSDLVIRPDGGESLATVTAVVHRPSGVAPPKVLELRVNSDRVPLTPGQALRVRPGTQWLAVGDEALGTNDRRLDLAAGTSQTVDVCFARF